MSCGIVCCNREHGIEQTDCSAWRVTPGLATDADVGPGLRRQREEQIREWSVNMCRTHEPVHACGCLTWLSSRDQGVAAASFHHGSSPALCRATCWAKPGCAAQILTKTSQRTQIWGMRCCILSKTSLGYRRGLVGGRIGPAMESGFTFSAG